MSTFINSLKNGIPKINIQAMNLTLEHRLFLFYLSGIVVGTFVFHMFLEDYAGNLGIYSEYMINGADLYGENINKLSFFIYCLKKYILEMSLIIIVNITSLGKWFNNLFCLYKGAVMAVLISSATLFYGVGGLFIYIISVFPHYFIYIPMIVLCIATCTKIIMAYREKKNGKDIKSFNFKVIMRLVQLVGMALLISFLEVYVNYPVLKYIFVEKS